MITPPAILDLYVKKPDSRPVRLWLPLFLLWPPLFVLGVLALVLSILVDVALYALGRRYHHYTLLLVRSIAAFNAMHGTAIRINNGKTTVGVTVL